jgi:hypothetical protein
MEKHVHLETSVQSLQLSMNVCILVNFSGAI